MILIFGFPGELLRVFAPRLLLLLPCYKSGMLDYFETELGTYPMRKDGKTISCSGTRKRTVLSEGSPVLKASCSEEPVRLTHRCACDVRLARSSAGSK